MTTSSIDILFFLGLFELEMVCWRCAYNDGGFFRIGCKCNVHGGPIEAQNTSCGIQPTFIRSLCRRFPLSFVQLYVDRTRSWT